VTVRDVVRRDGRVCGVRVAEAGVERELAADLVIGCDGRASAVRKRAGLELTLLPEGYDVLWFKAPAPERLRDRCSMMLCASANRAAACYTSWDGRLQLALTLPKGRYARERNADWLEELRRTLPPWLAAHLATVRATIEEPVFLDVIVGRCREWSAPGVLLLGDAAHPMSPIRAQGINVALRDAIVAANHLVPALRGPDLAAIDTAARAVQAEREPEIVRAQTLQLRDARGFQSRMAPLLLAFARRAGRLGRFRWAQRAWLRAQHDLRFGSTEVRLHV
jgi:2-polyprenyl-6-methoxyphenol hydroxylase-like FAD-dependent oxidoreductase